MSSEWEKFRQEQDQKSREAEARAREHEQQRQLAEQQRINETEAEGRRLERLRRREIEKGQESVRQLEQEAREIYHIYDIAESIRSRWVQQGANVQVTPIQEAHVELNDDGTLKRNRSYVGVRISYDYRDVKTETVAVQVVDEVWDYTTSTDIVTKNRELSLGFGYFGDNKLFLPSPQDDWWKRQKERIPQLIPATHYEGYYWEELLRHYPTIVMPFSNEERQKGVKSYYIDRLRAGGTYHIAIPVAYADSQDMFFTILDRDERLENPGILPGAAQRVIEFSRRNSPQISSTPQKPGFFKRLFRGGWYP